MYCKIESKHKHKHNQNQQVTPYLKVQEHLYGSSQVHSVTFFDAPEDCFPFLPILSPL
jgi:hypothetical protein